MLALRLVPRAKTVRVLFNIFIPPCAAELAPAVFVMPRARLALCVPQLQRTCEASPLRAGLSARLMRTCAPGEARRVRGGGDHA